MPDTFLKGIGLSVYQNSGDDTSNWTKFIRESGRVKDADKITLACDFWNRYEEDIALAKEFGINAFRLSLEWSRLEPRQGEFDEEAIQRYRDIFQCLEKNRLEPMVTLHHFTHPQWFEDLGGFTKEENIALFVNYCKKAFSLFGSGIRLWGTFNEATCVCFCGYVMGIWPPGNRMNFQVAGVVLLNMLRAHTAVYNAIKLLPGGRDAQVGMVHQHMRFEPKAKGLSLSYVRPLTRWMTFWFGCDVILKYFQTGEFEWRAPMKGITLKVQDDKPPLDWWGINYYSRLTIDWKFQVGGTNGEGISDTGFPIHPAGMYRAIKDSSSLDVPIYITEWGMADGKDNQRHHLIGSYFNQIWKAISEGYDVQGIFYWTLMDNIEWHEGYHIKYGLYEWNFSEPERRTLRPHSKVLETIYKAVPDTLEEIKQSINSLQPQEEAVVLEAPESG